MNLNAVSAVKSLQQSYPISAMQENNRPNEKSAFDAVQEYTAEKSDSVTFSTEAMLKAKMGGANKTESQAEVYKKEAYISESQKAAKERMETSPNREFNWLEKYKNTEGVSSSLTVGTPITSPSNEKMQLSYVGDNKWSRSPISTFSKTA